MNKARVSVVVQENVFFLLFSNSVELEEREQRHMHLKAARVDH